MNTPFFTVVIPTHNRAELLGEATQSVLTQTFQNFELLVIDDHSTDHTKSVATSFKDHRIKYIMNDRANGGAGTRNAGIFRAKGDWVAFLDDDDVWLPDKLELQYDKIQEVDSSVGLIYSGYAAYDFTERRVIITYVPEKEGWIQGDLLYKNYIGTFDTVVIRTDFLRKVGGLDERFPALQDMELYVRISGISKITFIDKTLVYKRTTNSDRIGWNIKKRLAANLLFWDKYKNLINQDPRLKHHTASRVLVYAFITNSIPLVAKALPWTFLGVIFDRPNLIWTFRQILSHIYNKRALISTPGRVL
jgi:glycosyltransferase involved in cell wall biosynthesis